MIIKNIALGNSIEAYVERSFSDSINIISSDDNNKGKTIVMQALAYCLGNIPAFPSSFDYKSYYYFVEMEHEGKTFIICRKGDTFVILHESSLMFFDSISEMKRYWSKNISTLPQIVKNDIIRTVDPELFVQLFFVGQDKKDTSNIANSGFYTKVDFYNMIFSIAGLGSNGLSPEELAHAKSKIINLKNEKSTLLKNHKILKSRGVVADYISQYKDKSTLESKIQELEKVKNKIATLKISRKSAMNRMAKYEITLKELKSLNRSILAGELRCLDCSSTHIGFTPEINAAYAFDISTPEIRNQIVDSINEKISVYSEEIGRYTAEINLFQKQLQELLSDDDISLESIVIHKRIIMDASGVEEKISELNEEISILESAMKTSVGDAASQAKSRTLIISEIVSEMNKAYKRIDSFGNLSFNDIFTKRDQIFSGSEATEFHLLKLYAIAKSLKHAYPIIVDSFRAEDLSTEKEKRVIDLFAELEKQVIFTTTLKTEELGKYDRTSGINHIDYSDHTPSKLLTADYLPEFLSLAQKLSIVLR